MNNLLKTNPNNGQVLLEKSQVLIKLKLYEEAVTTLRHLVSVEPTNPQPWLLLSTALKALQRDEEATAAHNRYLKISPQKPSTPDINITSGNNNGVANLDNQAFLNNYCLALFHLESRNQELLNAREDLKWYNNQLNEADRLAIQFDLKSASSLPAVNLPAFSQVAKERVELALAKASSEVTEYKNIQNQFKETQDRLQKQFEDTMSQLRSKLDSDISELKKKREIIENAIQTTAKNIDSLQTKKMIEILLIVGAGVVTALISQNLVAVIIIMLVIWGISSNLVID
ncbi:tetratricopeptide repeat protein [Tychonema sp. LEGE 07203]|uniref:tetratricopeptide repeat protein n=1 Tax=Tychonema sp. LEGE 07203 TaxID=1828671 RepID=UPI00187F060D|nr:hypothetical protein [Tychonema sp. LEGE 07203]